MRPATRRWVPVLLASTAVVLVTVGILVLWVWDAPVPPLGLIERDVDGLDCGAPLDNPGWDTGQPCHGAVNRQTAMGWWFLIAGVGSIVAATVWSRVTPGPGITTSTDAQALGN